MSSGIRSLISRRGALIKDVRALVIPLWPAYLLATVLILWGITWGLPDNKFVDKSFQADENAAVWAISQIHPPAFNPHVFNWGTALFYQAYVVKQVVSLGGLFPVGNTGTLLIGRLIVWLSALGVVTCVFFLGRNLFDRSTGLLAAAFLSVYPGFVITSHYFKTDIPMTFFLLTAMLAGYRLMEKQRTVDVCLLGFLCGYSISTKYSAAALLPVGLVFLLLSTRNRRVLLIWVPAFVATVAVGFLFGTPRILPYPGELIATVSRIAAINHSGELASLARGPALKDYLISIAQLGLTWPAWVAALLGMAMMLYRSRKEYLPIWAFLLCYSLVLWSDNTRLLRYIVPLLPFCAIFCAVFFGKLRGLGRRGSVVRVGAYALIAYSCLFSASYVRAMAAEDPRVQASRWFAAHVTPGTVVAATLSHYLDGPQLQLQGLTKLDVGTDLSKFRKADCPYFVYSEFIEFSYGTSMQYSAEAQKFFSFMRSNYTEVARFENPQQLVGIQSKKGLRITQDWLHPNPRIVIYRANSAARANIF